MTERNSSTRLQGRDCDERGTRALIGRVGFHGFGCILGAMLAATPAQAEEVLNAQQLDAIANKVRDFKGKDQFDLPPSPPELKGRRFSYTVEPRETGPHNLICEGFPSWGYWQKDSHYEVGAGNSDFSPDKLQVKNGPALQIKAQSKWDSVYFQFMSFSCDKRYLPPYTASNAFGGQVQVEKTTERVTAMAVFNGGWNKSDYWKTQAVGDVARHLANNVRVRVSGHLSQWPDGRTLLCGTLRGITPSMSYPYDKHVDICIFAAVPELLEFIDASNGEVLYSTTANVPGK